MQAPATQGVGGRSRLGVTSGRARALTYHHLSKRPGNILDCVLTSLLACVLRSDMCCDTGTNLF